MANDFINLKEVLGRLILVINLKRLLKVMSGIQHGYVATVCVPGFEPDHYGFLFNCRTVGQASDLMTALT